MEQGFDFATEDTQSGFRLSFFELYNWGTFDKSIVRVHFDKENALLTGDIGSGKSTIVDAITTLLVPHQKITYNKAAGAESKERSLSSYILGEYKNTKDETFSKAKAITLREGHESFTVLLAHFINDGYEEEVSIAQFFYISNHQVHKFFIVSKRKLEIKKDFFDFKDVRELKKRLRKNTHISVYESFSDYSKSFRRLMGIRNEQALNLFYQTVSLKSIGNLTQFIRIHMLEPNTVESMIDMLCQNFSELNHIHTLVLRAKRQIVLLSPIDKEGKKYETNKEAKEKYEQYRNTLNAYFAHFKIGLLERKINEIDIELSKKNSQKTKVDKSQESLNNKLIDLKIELKQSGGERLSSIDREIIQEQKTVIQKKNQHQDYNVLAKKLAMATVSTEHRFLNNFKDAQLRFETIETKATALQNENIMESVAMKRYEKNSKELGIELAYLQKHRSNIPHKISSIRDEMLVELGLKVEDLPFVGELIRVKDRLWEGAIERVLHSFALSLLVDNQYYTAVSAYVEKTNLKGKLVYLKVDNTQRKEHFEVGATSLIHKIYIKEESLFFDSLTMMVQDRFNIPCVESMTDFRRFKKALTMQGQIKSSFSRHEKDDRYEISDRRQWVLGWENSSKVQKIQEDYRHEKEKISHQESAIKKITEAVLLLSTSRDDLRDILKYKAFEEIDWYFYAHKIEALHKEKEALEQSSDIIKYLETQIELTQTKLETQKEIRDGLNQKIGELKQNIEQRESEKIEANTKLLENETLERLLLELESYYSDNNKVTLTLNNIKIEESRLRELTQKKIDSFISKQSRNAENIIRDMGIYLSEFKVDSKDFDASIESLSEFRFKLTELKKDNLPKWEKRFKALFREKTIQNIVIVQQELEHQSKEIEEKIQKINDSLKDIEYNDGTYIELMAQKSMDREIREFIQSLKEAISGSIGDENVYDEPKFLQIKEIIERLNGREGSSDSDKKWKKLVTDVRNWYDFSAMERYISDGSEKEFYSHSGGKSGGQKEKLAYTVLASSLAFQFGLEHDKIRSRSFRFVMIDEAFGRGSDESSRYALRLFKKLNLQLLVITPKQKINIIEPFVKTVHFVHNKDGMYSSLFSMSIEDFIEKKNA